MTLDLDTLDRLARAATPGPWAHCNWDPMERPHVYAEALLREHNATPPLDLPYSPADAAYIAALSPDVTRALIARLRAAERVVEAAQAWSSLWFSDEETADMEAEFVRAAAALRDALAAHAETLP